MSWMRSKIKALTIRRNIILSSLDMCLIWLLFWIVRSGQTLNLTNVHRMLICIVCSGISLFTLAHIFLKNVTADWKGARMFDDQHVVSGSTIQQNVYPNCIQKCSLSPLSKFQKWSSSNSRERLVYDSLVQIEWFILRLFRAWEWEFYNLLWAANNLHSTCRRIVTKRLIHMHTIWCYIRYARFLYRVWWKSRSE